MSASIRIMGLREAEAYLARLGSSARDIERATVLAGTKTVYAWGIEFGRRRKGRLARKLGGTFALTDAFKSIKPSIAGRVARALPRGPGAVLAALQNCGNDVVTRTKELLIERLYSVPVPLTRSGQPKWGRTSNLRRSYHMETRTGGPRSGYRE